MNEKQRIRRDQINKRLKTFLKKKLSREEQRVYKKINVI